MKIRKIFYKIFLLLLLIIIINPNLCWAKDGLPDLSLFEPSVSAGSMTERIGKVLGILMILGTVIIVVAVVMIGFNTILGSASEKAEHQQKLTVVIFAGIFMLASSAIAKFLISIAETF